MKAILLLIATCFTCSLVGQVGYDETIWNVQVGIEEMMIFNPETEDLTASVAIEIDGEEFEKDIVVKGQDWVTVSYTSLGLTYEKMPESSGTVYALITVEAGGQGILGDYYYISVRNRLEAYGANIKELGDRVNIYGSIIDDCVFWIDFNGYNYVIRSRNDEKDIFLSHWIMNIQGETERLNYYKGFSKCENGKSLIQHHSMGFTLIDADEDAYMEFYSLVVDGCVDDWQHPVPATLVVFAEESGMELKGRTYSMLEDATDIGGDYNPSPQLSERPLLLLAAEAAWEVFIME